MNMFDVIYTRKSIRKYLKEKIEWNTIAEILEFADNLPMLIEGIPMEFKLVSNIEEKQGFHGPLALKAPYYICLSSEEKEGYLLNAGYLMQQLNLYIVSKGLGTCFIGSATPGRSLKSSMKYKYVITLAFGKTSQPLYRDSSEAKRLPEKDLVVYKEEVPCEIKNIINAARLAPSSHNNQPWRFVAYKNRIHIFTKKSTFITKAFDTNKMIDMGIMMANLLLSAEEQWVNASIIKSDVIENMQFQNNEYVLSVKID